MKITLEISNTEIAQALLDYFVASPNRDILKAAVKAYALKQGSDINDGSVYLLNPDNSITITTTFSPAVVVTPPVVVVSPAPPLVPTPKPEPPAPVAGHMVQVDPPYSVTGIATCFGINTDGKDDTGDMLDGKDLTGFFIDPKTGKTYVTHNKTIRGVSLPREVMLSTFMAIDSWKTEGIKEVWSRNEVILRQWVLGNQPMVTIDSCGLSESNLPIVDAGPSANTAHAIDLTYNVSMSLKTQGEALATYMILLKGVAMKIKGWDFAAGKVG